MKPELKIEEEAEFDVLKDIIAHLKSMLGDEDLMGDKPVVVEVTEVETAEGDEAMEESMEESMEEVIEEQLEVPEVDDELDTGENLEDAVEEAAEDDLDIDIDDLKNFLSRG